MRGLINSWVTYLCNQLQQGSPAYIKAATSTTASSRSCASNSPTTWHSTTTWQSCPILMSSSWLAMTSLAAPTPNCRAYTCTTRKAYWSSKIAPAPATHSSSSKTANSSSCAPPHTHLPPCLPSLKTSCRNFFAADGRQQRFLYWAYCKALELPFPLPVSLQEKLGKDNVIDELHKVYVALKLG